MAYEAARAKDRPVIIETLSAHPLDNLVGVEAATWLDLELTAAHPVPLRDAGFGRDLRDALARRRQWLVTQGLAGESDGRVAYAPGMIAELRRRELLRVGAQLAHELGVPFAESRSGTQVDGIYRKPVDAISGRFALIEKSREFTLAPWRSTLDLHVGKPVSGILRGDAISWSFGRSRGGPSIG